MPPVDDQLESQTETSAAEVINLCGETCPDTFVKARLALDELEEGQLLEVVVDDERSSRRIPRNMENHGQEHLSTEKEDGIWRMWFRKKGDSQPDRWIVMD